MKREILFRGKRVDGHGWAEGGIVLRANGQIFISPIVNASQIIISAVDPDTVGQYTGLKDRNGKRIFEGDVVEYRGVGWDWEEQEMVRAVVVWEYGGWTAQESDGCYLDPMAESEETQMTVIGNIYDNPELLNHETTTRNGG